MAPPLSKVKRKAAGFVMLQAFHIQESAVNHILRLIMDGHDRMGLGQGLTAKEREQVQAVASSLHKYSNWMRTQGNRYLEDL